MKRESIQIGLSQFRIPFDELFSSDWLCQARRVVEKPVTGDKTTVTLIFHVNVSPAFLSVTFSVEFVQSEVSSWSKFSKKSIFSFKKDSFKYLRSVYHLRWFFCKIFYNSNPDSDRAIVNLFYSKSLNTRRLKFHWDWYFFLSWSQHPLGSLLPRDMTSYGTVGGELSDVETNVHHEEN